MESINFKNNNLKNNIVDCDDIEYITVIPNNNINNNNNNNVIDNILINNDNNPVSQTLDKNKSQIKNDNDISDDYKELKKEFNNFLENVLIGTTKIKNILRKIDKHINKNEINKMKLKNKNTTINKDKGFAEEKNVPKQIQLFFNLENDIKMPRTKIGGLFQDYLKKNNLKGNIGEKNKIDKRIYRLNNELAKLFNVSEEQMIKINSCSSSKIKYPDGYNFHNYQTWIKKIYDEENL
jgi:hypothetical protein